MIILETINVPKPILIVRDDLFPFLYGGNKARKALEYEEALLKDGYNAMVTTGGIQSNHCRVMALLAARHGWDCHIVYHGSEKRFYQEAGNALLVRKTNASVEFVEAYEISDSMNSAMRKFQEIGKKPYYVTGGGHDLSGGVAYAKAVQELSEKLKENNKKIDRIFLPCGTGSTQAGIIVGLSLVGLRNVEVVGISVARNMIRAVEVTSEFVSMLARHYNIKEDLSSKVIISDEFLFGGYEGTTDEIREWLGEVGKRTGVFFDSTYSGKALWGMKEMISRNNWEDDNNLFWHTGGVMNILA